MIPRDIASSPVKVTGSTPDDVQFESVLEENYLFLVRFDPEVERYDRCREKVVWLGKEGEERSYGPDFEITYRPSKDGVRRRNRVVEVKPDLIRNPYDRKTNLPRDESPAENSIKWKVAKKQLAGKGKEFVVVKSPEIETNFLKNAKFLLMYLDHPPPLSEADRITEALRSSGPVTLRNFLATLTQDRQRRAELLPTLYLLIAKRKIAADLTRILCFDTVISLL